MPKYVDFPLKTINTWQTLYIDKKISAREDDLLSVVDLIILYQTEAL